jgi:hypothetical protein
MIITVWKEIFIVRIIQYREMFNTRALRKAFGAKRDELKGEWRRLHNEELHAVYSSQINYYSNDQINKNEMGGECGTYRGQERRIQGFGGETWWKETTWKTQA